MPRTLNATLKAAMDSGVFNAYIQAIYYNTLGVAHERDVLWYKLTGTELEVITSDFVGSTYPAYIALKRGVVVDGTAYTLTTSKFYIAERQFEVYTSTKKRVYIRATLFPEDRISVNGGQIYSDVISAFCTAYGKTATFDDPAAAYWSYQFLPVGTTIVYDNSMQFLNLLRQKYFIFAADLGAGEILFYHAMDNRDADVQYTVWYQMTVDFTAGDIVTNNLINLTVKPQAQRTYMAKDETGALRTGGTANKPIHNLGYLEAADSFPTKSTNPDEFEWTMPINLYPLDGDIVEMDPDYLNWYAYPIQVIEEFDPKKKSMGWTTTIKQCQAFENTVGGALPGALSRLSSYSPLSTTHFDKILDQTDNNLQAAMDTLDNHQHEAPIQIIGNLNLATVAAGATDYTGPGTSLFSATRLDVAFTTSGACKISNLKVRTSSAQPATGSLVITLMNAATATALEATVPANGGAGSYTDVTDEIDVASGQTVSLRFVNNAAAASAQVAGWSLRVKWATV